METEEPGPIHPARPRSAPAHSGIRTRGGCWSAPAQTLVGVGAMLPDARRKPGRRVHRLVIRVRNHPSDSALPNSSDLEVTVRIGQVHPPRASSTRRAGRFHFPCENVRTHDNLDVLRASRRRPGPIETHAVPGNVPVWRFRLTAAFAWPWWTMKSTPHAPDAPPASYRGSMLAGREIAMRVGCRLCGYRRAEAASVTQTK